MLLLRNVKISFRLMLAFGFIVFLMLLQGVYSSRQMAEMQNVTEEINSVRLPSVRAVGELSTQMMRFRIFNLRLIAETDSRRLSETENRINILADELKRSQAAYEKFINRADEQLLYQKFVVAQKNYFDIQAEVLKLVRAGDLAQAKEILNTRAADEGDTIAKNLLALADLHESDAKKAARISADVYRKNQQHIIIILVVVGIISMLSAIIITRSIVSPLSQAVISAELVAGGDLSKNIVIEGRDEPAQLLGALSLMQDNLRSAVMQIANSSTQLASATEELNSVAEDASRSLQKQNEEIQQAATAVTEMSAAVDDVARNATDTSESSTKSSGLAQQGRARVLETVNSIERMTGEVGKTSVLISGLAEKSQDIGKVLDVIRAIAEQTNLLALNAAIEAARAGEAGRGFAVVADEVRALAHRTQVSTQEIEAMIGSIQSGTDAAVNSMKESATRADETLGVAREADKALEEITRAIAQITERNLLIASASEQQAVVAREVDRNLVNISDLSTQSAAGANQTSAASHELARLAVELNTLVSRFVV